MDEDFNSSDLEFDKPVDPYAWASAASIKDIINNAIEEKIESRRRRRPRLLLCIRSPPRPST